MRRLTAATLLGAAAIALAFPAAGASDAPTDPVHGPSCSDIEVVEIAYTTRGGTIEATLTATLQVSGGVASCSFVDYALYVYSADGLTLLTSQDFLGTLVWEVQGAPSSVCVYATSRINKVHVADTAPNGRCGSGSGNPIPLSDAAPGGTGFE